MAWTPEQVRGDGEGGASPPDAALRTPPVQPRGLPPRAAASYKRPSVSSLSLGALSCRTSRRSCLPYSGGLDTSIILKWLQTTYGAEVVTFTADLGQGEELEPARRKAELLGIKEITSRTCARNSSAISSSPMMRMNALYEGVYLLGHVDRAAAHRQAPGRDRA